uniref:Transmembrane protein n=1 Tax=Astyanax mexicanus TaxID=7994 RepID=A0A8B9HC40_ASTMX
MTVFFPLNYNKNFLVVLQMCVSIIFAIIGVIGAIFSFAVAIVGLIRGLDCKHLNLQKREECTNLENMAEFNVTLFSILLVTSILQFFLCGAQMINGLLGCLCGTCTQERPIMPVPIAAPAASTGQIVVVTTRI